MANGITLNAGQDSLGIRWALNLKFDNEHLALAEQPYTSIQGEGRFYGIPMTYVRTQGCNVGCGWCDSQYTWSPYNVQKIKEKINPSKPFEVDFDKLKQIIDYEDSTHIWFTGGEPMMQSRAISNYLLNHKDMNKFYHICTALQDYDHQLFQQLDYITVDVKAPQSDAHTDMMHLRKVYDNFQHKLELKMVVSHVGKDRAFAQLIAKLYPEVSLTLQPQYVSESGLIENPKSKSDEMMDTLPSFAAWINSWARKYKNVRMGTQFHKHIWPDRPRMI